ncbi:hypothetical protein R1sor_012321 [Riccia sorocarpa]|uniref:Uncharacterized protein n=1 Tax=Riccia sorocarpa TaxID=122646 RepID=A0ABD3I714_9MARC
MNGFHEVSFAEMVICHPVANSYAAGEKCTIAMARLRPPGSDEKGFFPLASTRNKPPANSRSRSERDGNPYTAKGKIARNFLKCPRLFQFLSSAGLVEIDRRVEEIECGSVVH